MQINVRAANFPFYRDLLTFLGWESIEDDEHTIAFGDSNRSSLWFQAIDSNAMSDYDALGMNHLAIHTSTQADVDTVAAWLTERGVAHLFDTPSHRPEFTWEEGQTYYQVMFETPDRVLIEVVYIGPLQ
jgi:catechol 2,3-dioxygenase-like lactoylglutathione lyase family enzyme